MNTKKTGEAQERFRYAFIPEDLSSVDEEHPLKFEVLKEGLIKEPWILQSRS